MLFSFVARPGCRKSHTMFRIARSRVPAIVYSPPAIEDANAWPRLSAEEYLRSCAVRGRGMPRVVLDAEPEEFLDAVEPLLRANYPKCVALDEAHELFGDADLRKRMRRILRTHRHGSADLMLASQSWVGLAEVRRTLDVAYIGGVLDDRYDAKLVSAFDWKGRRATEGDGAFPAWARNVPLEELVVDPRFCRTLIEANTRAARLTWHGANCSAYRDAKGRKLECACPR